MGSECHDGTPIPDLEVVTTLVWTCLTPVKMGVPVLSVVDISPEAVKFTVDGTSSFPAASNSTITFKFTAEKTPIYDGSVSFTIPARLGSEPALPSAAVTVLGRLGAPAMPGTGTGEWGGTKDGEPDAASSVSKVGSRGVKIAVKRLDLGSTITIAYGKGDDLSLLHAMKGDVEVRANFETKAGASTRSRDAGTATVTLTNVSDGVAALVMIEPDEIGAGSTTGPIEVTFKAAGSMPDGHVSLEIPAGWGRLQRDPSKRNYITISGNSNVSLVEPALDGSAIKAVAEIKKLEKDGIFKFVYGGGSHPANNGVDVPSRTGVYAFTIRSDGDGNGVFADITSKKELEGDDTVLNPDKLGTIFDGAAGVLNISVATAAAEDGAGSVTVAPATPVRAGNLEELTFTYTSTQTIQDGELRFTVPGAWKAPQLSDAGAEGYTTVDGDGLGTAEVPANKRYVKVPIISIVKDDPITIKYGASPEGKVMVPAAVGESVFPFSVRATTNGELRELTTGPAKVKIDPQASGKAKSATAVTSDGQGDLYAGQMGREITVTYTALAQMVQGQVRLTIPAEWSEPSVDNIDVDPSSGGSADDPMFEDQKVIVEGVNLLSGGTVTFVYTGDVQPEADDAKFAVATHGGLEDDAFEDVAGPTDDDVMLTLPVGYAAVGSGMAEIADSDRVVAPGATGVTLTFTYTAAGEIQYPSEFRVRVPESWSAPTDMITAPDNIGTYTVTHKRGGQDRRSVIVGELDPVDRDMVARVNSTTLNVKAGDQIIFEYQNATAPATAEVSNFRVLFGGQTNDAQVGDVISVFVQSAMPSQLALSSRGTVSADAGAAPLEVTVSLQDAAGMAAVMVSPTSVTLTSSSEGTFSEMMGEAGTAPLTVSIPAGDSSKIVYYSDSIVGTPTITATAANLTTATHDVSVTSSVLEIVEGSVMVSSTIAKDGDTVTVTAMATAGQAPLALIETVMAAGGLMTDSLTTPGTYTRSVLVATGTPDGTYTVTVSLGGEVETAADMLTVDNTAPDVAVTAPESAEDGETVMISATVTDAGTVSSVTADVSALDSTQTMLTLAIAADGSYSAPLEISDVNTALNGAKTITVTAIDAAGNSGTGTASVMLDNKLSFTSMIGDGITLFHVPLDDDDFSTIGDLRTALGDKVSSLVAYQDGRREPSSDNIPITAGLGIIVILQGAAEITFAGEPWGGGTAVITLEAGSENLIGLPLDIEGIDKISDIKSLFADDVVAGVYPNLTDFVAAEGDTGDGDVVGDAAYYVLASAAATITVTGEGWSNSTEMAGAAPIALSGYKVDNQTPVLSVFGSVVDEITGAAKEGFRVKVKNLSTKGAVSEITSIETADGYSMTLLDLANAHAARVGDVLEISADSPNPLIGVQPVRHTVTVDDVKNSTIQLEDLIAYEIPAETELLRNFPNPFNPETWIPYHLSEDADVNLTIYDINGEVVRDIDVGHQNAAKYDSRAKAIYWDGRNRFGEQVASGIYFYHLNAGDFSGTRKMVILK